MRRSPNVFGDVRNIFLAYEQTQADRQTDEQKVETGRLESGLCLVCHVTVSFGHCSTPAGRGSFFTQIHT